MLSSNCVAATHNTTYPPCTSTCNTHPWALYPSQCLPPPSFSHKPTQGKMAQDVGMVWKYCGVIPILFGWFLWVPSLHVLVCIQKTFLRLVTIKPLQNTLVHDLLLPQMSNGTYVTSTCELYLETRVGYRVGQGFVSRNASRNIHGCVQGKVQLLPYMNSSYTSTSLL